MSFRQASRRRTAYFKAKCPLWPYNLQDRTCIDCIDLLSCAGLPAHPSDHAGTIVDMDYVFREVDAEVHARNLEDHIIEMGDVGKGYERPDPVHYHVRPEEADEWLDAILADLEDMAGMGVDV